MLDADANRADLELRLIKLLLKDRARVHPFAGNGGSWAQSGRSFEMPLGPNLGSINRAPPLIPARVMKGRCFK